MITARQPHYIIRHVLVLFSDEVEKTVCIRLNLKPGFKIAAVITRGPNSKNCRR